MTTQDKLTETITDFANIQEQEFIGLRVFQCAMQEAIEHIGDNPEAIAAVAKAALQAATDEEVNIDSDHYITEANAVRSMMNVSE